MEKERIKIDAQAAAGSFVGCCCFVLLFVAQVVLMPFILLLMAADELYAKASQLIRNYRGEHQRHEPD